MATQLSTRAGERANDRNQEARLIEINRREARGGAKRALLFGGRNLRTTIETPPRSLGPSPPEPALSLSKGVRGGLA